MNKDKLENKIEVPECIKNLGEEAVQLYQEGRAILSQQRRSLMLAQAIRLSAPPKRYSLTDNYQ